MVGGGMYVLAGVLVLVAGRLAWLSIVLGGAIALATVHSYGQLTAATRANGVPVTIFAREGQRRLAGVLGWWLVAVYVLALAVYTFSAGHYLGSALGVHAIVIVAIEVAIVGGLALVNIRAVESPILIQIVAVWLQFGVLAWLAIAGLPHLDSAHLGDSKSAADVLEGAALTFVAFEGFEMIAYDLRELHRPQRVMRQALPAAVLVVAATYVVVTLGAVGLVGSHQIIMHRDTALAFAGHVAGGTAGLIAVTAAACLSALTAINATLFSTARLARTAAEQRLLPHAWAHTNRHGAPARAIAVIAAAAIAIAATVGLATLVGLASLGFLGLFCLVNVMAFRRTTRRRWIAAVGALGAAGGVIAISISYLG